MAQITTRIAAFAALFLALNIGCSSAQDRRQNEPGQFDFYVLSLSWSPSFCDAATERSPERAARDQQCGERPFSFVVDAVWPQYEKGAEVDRGACRRDQVVMQRVRGTQGAAAGGG